jgi:hypothetical protein
MPGDVVVRGVEGDRRLVAVHTCADAVSGRVEMMLAGFVALVCGLSGLVYFISTRRSMPPMEAEQEREKYRVLRDTPPH